MNALALALLGGIALAVQNLVLAAMAARGLTYQSVLLLNTLVGLGLLLAINLATSGTAFVGTIASACRPWFVVPGLLGSFVVFCMVFGYSRAGAAAPTVGLIAGQVLAAVALDALQIGPGSRQLSAAGVLGALLVAAGAALFVFARR
ncbi:MAG TPA: DMT family transporter [Burkholderiaceae bacterium]|nr:DMT family transporter [Burkholderiaceae bacterium]